MLFCKVGADTDTNDVLIKKWPSINTIAIVVAAECTGIFLNVLETFVAQRVSVIWKLVYSCVIKAVSRQKKVAESADFIELTGQCVVESKFCEFVVCCRLLIE